MKSFQRMFAAMIMIICLLFAGVNLFLLQETTEREGRPWRVEINRIAVTIEESGLESIDLREYSYVVNVEKYRGDGDGFFEGTGNDYLIRQIGGELYRFDYEMLSQPGNRNHIIMVNGILGILSFLLTGVMIYLYQKIVKPFGALCEVPYELSRGNLTVPLKENKNRFFGRFLWGMDILRENMEQQKERELALKREKKTLVLSISHDIKTPLSAIKLYAKALSRGLYRDTDKQAEIAECINDKADEIEGFVSQIIKASKEDLYNPEVVCGEFYLSELVGKISAYYREKLGLIRVSFQVGEYSDCILRGDPDRSVEVVQNMIENAVKYGDGHWIEIVFSEEEDCQLLTVRNSGCTLAEAELPHVFESFWRGSNAGGSKGSGLGLYICRQLMHRMGGEMYAEIRGDVMCVTAVFGKG